ncbi:MAG: hypothetical protein QXP57_05650 [Nitrososphaerota archaeon]
MQVLVPFHAGVTILSHAVLAAATGVVTNVAAMIAVDRISREIKTKLTIFLFIVLYQVSTAI